MDNHTTHNGAALPYGSTFRPPPLPPPNPPPPVPGPPVFQDPLKPRGGVQVLPPVVPPRGPAKSKPRPPVPPKRDQLTRLTTVPGPPPRDEAKPLEALERKINSSSPPNKPLRKPNYENTYQMEPPLSYYDNKILSNSSSRTSFKDSPKESSSEEEGATADIWVRAIDSPVKKPDRMFRSNSTSDDQRETKARLVHRASIDNAFIKSPPLKKVPQKPQVIVEQKESDSKDDCRPEETPFPKFEENIFLKNDEKLTNDRSFFKSNSKPDDKVHHGEKFAQNIADSSLPPLPKFDEEFMRPDVEVTSANEDDGASDTEKSRVELERMKIESREGERLKVGLDCLAGSRPGSRATSRSSSPFGEKERKKISAAEALGVVAKPCPRPPPGKRVKNHVEFRRQSLGNLSDSKLSMGCSASCPSHQLWSSFGECQENEYRRHERARGQSADSRTLQRLKSDNWETQSYSSTLSRIGKYSTSKYFAKTAPCPDRSAACPAAANPGSGERPKSVCNCGRHTTGSVPTTRDVGKRTFSVEELRSGGFVRGSSTTGSARSSFGKSPRVTFALSEDEGASGTSKYGDGGGGDPRRMSGRARSYDADDRFQNNRSHPPGGSKQATKTRSLSQSTPPGVSNGSDVPNSQETTPSQDNAMMFREGNLVSGRLEALVRHLVPTADYYPDRAFLFAFLLTSRLFIKPHDLLGQILALSDAQLKSKQSAKERAALLPRMVQLLGEWSETFPYDFRDERVMSHVRDVAHRCVSVEGPVRQEVSLLLHNLLYRLKKLEQYEAFLHSIHTEATTSSLESLSQTDVNELCGSAESLAQQLTHIELERLSYIGPEEFVQAFAKESPALETSFKDMKQTRNLESYVSWFNRLSYFVATEVCKHIKSKKQRVRIVEFWVETARECFNIGNFNSLMAIIAGLNMSPISRLKRTWSKVQCAKFSVLEHQMDPSSNFSSYRSTLKAAVWRSAAATDDSQRIVIPFFSLLVKDLYFLNEGCSNKLPNGHINFEKFWQLAKQVTEFITWKQVHCPFPKAAKVITYLQATPVLNEDALALASFECEPPENHEKDRYKSLKAEIEKSASN